MDKGGLGLGLLLLLGMAGLAGIGIAVALTTRVGTASRNYYSQSDLPVAQAINEPPQPRVETGIIGRPVFANKQEWQFVRGSDRLIEKIIVTRELIKYE